MANKQEVSGVIIRLLGGQNAYKNNGNNLFWKIFKVTMPQLSKEEWAFVVEKYFKRKSCIAVQAAFWQQFNHASSCKKTIQKSVKKYFPHKTSLNRNKENSGWRSTIHSEENIERVRNMLEILQETFLQEEMAWGYLLWQN